MRAIALAVLLCCALPACATPLEVRLGDGDVVLENRADRALLYLALERGTAALIDPAPSWPVAEFAERRVEPGESRVIEVEGYSRGDDVVLFLYRVDPGAAEAPLARVLSVPHEQLRDAGFRVMVDRL